MTIHLLTQQSVRWMGALILSVLLLAGCTKKSAPEPSTQKAPAAEPAKQEAPAIADPTPPDPPNSESVPTDLRNMPAFLTLAIGGIAAEGEKEGIEVQEDARLFRTDATAQEILSFYAKEMKDRGWTTDNQVAQSGKIGLAMQEYRRAGTEAMYVIISEPEEAASSDPTKAKRHVALLPAKLTKTK